MEYGPAAGIDPYHGKVDMATEQVTQLSSLRAFQANVAVLRTADDMLGSLISQRG